MGAHAKFLPTALKKGVFYLTVIFTGMIIMHACRKTDSQGGTEKNQSDVVAKFLTLPASTTPAIRRIAAVLQKKNQRTGFLNTIAKRYGFAQWDKAVMGSSQKSAKKTSARSGSANDTIIYIPLALDNANHVNAFLFARLNDSISLQLYREKDYSSHSFGTMQDSTNNAEKLAVQFMLLDLNTFGHKDFKLLDERLFKNSTIPAGTLTKDRKVHIQSLINAQGRGSGYEMWEYEVCVSTTYLQCTANHLCCSDGSCSGCQAACWKTRTDCHTVTIFVYVDDNDWSGGGGGGDTPIDGGGGGGGNNPGTPCNPTPLLDNGAIPCEQGDTTGWTPISEPAPKNPCNQVKDAADSIANPVYMQKVKDLTKPQNLNLGYEKSVALIQGATPAIKEDSGTVAIANIQMVDLPSGQKYKSLAHTHPNSSGGTYSIFSFGDVRKLSALLHSGQLEAGKFVAFLTTYKGTNYALAITDKSKFEDFFYYFNNTGDASQGNLTEWLASHNKAKAIESKYFLHKTNALITETDNNNNNVLEKFLDFMKEANLGVTLFETNANFSEFTKVEKDAMGTIKRTICN